MGVTKLDTTNNVYMALSIERITVGVLASLFFLGTFASTSTKPLAKRKYTTGPVSHIAVAKNPYLIENPEVCKGVKSIKFIGIVHSATSHFARRSAIRETWANHRLFQNHVTRTVFLIGDPQNKTVQSQINMEQTNYKDIVQGDFLDSYHNLTHKAVLSIRWIHEHCQQADYIVKADDDIFVNVFYLFEQMDIKFKNKKRHIWCSARRKGSSLIHREGKWKVSDKEFQKMTRYPFPDCMGYFAVISNDIIPELYISSKTTPFFWVDDVFLFGILAEDIGGVIHERIAGLNPFDEKRSIKCFESNKLPCRFYFTKAESEGVMDNIWIKTLTVHYRKLAMKYTIDELFADYKTLAVNGTTDTWSKVSKIYIPMS